MKPFWSLLACTLFIALISCEEPLPEAGLKEGVWRGQVTAQGNEIPFNFEVLKKNGVYSIDLINGEELQ